MENINYILGGVSDEEVEKFIDAFNSVGVPKKDTPLMVKIAADPERSFISKSGNFHLGKADLERSLGAFGKVKEVHILPAGQKSHLGTWDYAGHSIVVMEEFSCAFLAQQYLD